MLTSSVLALCSMMAADTQPVGSAAVAPEEMTYSYLNGLAHEASARRRAVYDELTTVDQIRAYQHRLREFFFDQLGEFPEKTPLNARIVDTLDRGDYRIEKVIFESRPGMFVTGLMYLPSSNGPHAAVLIPCGHADEAKAFETYQRVCVLLAKNGLAAFCFDPIGQGERNQVLDDAGNSIVMGVPEHIHLGVGAILLGINAASYEVWDAMRAVDYLQSRPDIDGEKIGCSGNSGGGTQTSYLMALDDRIACAAPNCFITNLPRLLDTIGPQDAEQNIHAQLAFGLDQTDYILLRAPKPTLIEAVTRDFFDIGGTWESFRDAKRIYMRLGMPEAMDLAESDSEHAWNKDLREATVRWMRRWLLKIDEPITEPDFSILTKEEALCTPEGQVLKLPGARSAFDFNSDLNDALRPGRDAFWEKAQPSKALTTVREIIGARKLDDIPPCTVTVKGETAGKNCVVRKLVLSSEPGIDLPCLLFVPTNPNGKKCVYVHGEAKHVDAGETGAIETLVTQGITVLAVDVRGIGETRPTKFGDGWDKLFGPLWREFFFAYILDKTFVGMRTEDILTCSRYLSKEIAGDATVNLIAIGETGIPALHAAALERTLFASLELKRTVRSWSDVVHTPISDNQLINAVHGALRFYDLPNLVASLPEGFVLYSDE